MQKLENILLESEHFFKKYSEEYPLAISTYDKISQLADTALSQNDNTLLLSQLSYMETGAGYLAFQYIGEARYLMRILHIITLEERYHTSSFSYGINTLQKLLEKYKLSLFSLRRILFTLSPESITEAEDFLKQNLLSPFAVYVLSKEELIVPNDSFFETIKEIYYLQWSNHEMQLFQQLINTFSEAQ